MTLAERPGFCSALNFSLWGRTHGQWGPVTRAVIVTPLGTARFVTAQGHQISVCRAVATSLVGATIAKIGTLAPGKRLILIRCAEHRARQQILLQFVDFPEGNNE